MSGITYISLSDELVERIESDRRQHWENPFRSPDAGVVRRIDRESDRATLWRPSYVRDVEKIMHVPYYNRYADKTQVFSFYANDDITRRALHVQLVSRIARNIGSVLGLNLDLIEAIALGHDIGHTPFGHAGERFLSELYHAKTGRFFRHNVQSVRVLDHLFARNLSVQTLDGILCHNGEFECREYRPTGNFEFSRLDADVLRCLTDADANDRLVPATLEGCVVRICDIIAYLGKDRQDAERAKIVDTQVFERGKTGAENAEIINNYVVNILENSYGRDEIRMDDFYFEELKRKKRENNALIYRQDGVIDVYREKIGPMFAEIYERMLGDLIADRRESVIFRHHVDFIEKNRSHYAAPSPYCGEEPNQIVVDFLASMTDDYFLDLYQHLFGRNPIEFKGYFEA